MDKSLVKLSVYGILTDGKNNVLLQKRANTTFGDGYWSLPGGHVENEESIFAAVQRELFEELGITFQQDHSSLCLTLARKPQPEKRYINFFYVISKWQGSPMISDGKASELLFSPITFLPQPILPYIQEALHLIDQGIQFYESAY